MASNADYIPLRRHLSLDDQEYDGLDEGSDADTEGTPSKRPRLIRTRTQRLPSAISLTALFSFAAFIISLLSSILVAYQLLFTSRALVQSVQRVYDIDVNALRRPSLYMGLERVPLTDASSDTDQGGSGAGHHDDGSHNSSKPQESAALPVGSGRATAISHVNLLNPFVPYPRDGWVLVTTYDVAVMQFAHTPVEQSSCAFQLSLPPRRALIQSARLLTLENPAASGGIPTLDIYTLDAPDIDLAQVNISWASRPPRRAYVGRIEARFGENATTPRFDCGGGGDRLTVELACIGDGCRVEYREEEGDPIIGLTLISA